jgi:hypothetical protein
MKIIIIIKNNKGNNKTIFNFYSVSLLKKKWNKSY